MDDSDKKWIDENVKVDIGKELIIVTLTPNEIKICELVGKARYNASRKAGVIDQRLDDSGEFLDFEGFSAEMAFCKHFNFYPDFTASARSGSYDVLTRKGNKVDVKYTKYENGHLLATLKKKNSDTDIYVLVIGGSPTYKIIGYIKADELFLDKNIKDFGHGKGYSVTQEELKSM